MELHHHAGKRTLIVRAVLTQHGHSIPGWIRGGCDEDWGLYYQSTNNETSFEYHICFFPAPQGTPQNQMIVQYHARLPFIKRLFGKRIDLLPDDQMHETMRSFGELFNAWRMLTKSQFEREYY